MSDISDRIASLPAERRELLERMIRERETGAAESHGDVLCRRDPEASSPLSFAQERLWFLCQMNPAQATYNVPVAIRLRGPINLDAFKRALAEVVRRHSVLRATFEIIDGKSVQKIGAAGPIDIPIIDLWRLMRSEREAEARRLYEEKAMAPFDLGRGPLLRASALRLGDEEHIVIIMLHHIVFDGWSLGIFLDELMTLYSSCAKDDPSPLPDPPAQYADFAQWERERFTPQAFESQLDFWRRRLGDSFPVLQLPFDRPRPAVQTFVGSRMTRVLPYQLVRALKALSQREGVTLFMTLLTLYKILLFRYSGQTDIFIGTPIANRQRPEWERLIGFFANTLVLRTDLSGDPSFRELLQRVRSVALESYEHQETPFEHLVSALRPERDLSHSTLFQAMFVMQESSRDFGAPGLGVELLDPPSGVSKFDLTLDVTASEDELKVTLEYNTDLFEAETVRRMLGQYRRLSESVVADPRRRLSELEMLTERERERLLVEWNRTDADYPREQCVHELFERQVELTPERTALAFEDEQLSYAELNIRANRLAHHLRKLGVGPDMRAAICLERGVEMVVAMLATLKAGGAYVPMDPAYPEERLAFMMEDAEAQVLLTQRRLLRELPQYKCQAVRLNEKWEEIAEQGEENLGKTAGPNNLAHVIYTSGSTGRPKGVAIEHRSVAVFLGWAGSAFQPGDFAGVLASTSICFDLSIFELFVPLSFGGKIILAENALQLPDLAAADQVTLINTVPSAMAELVRMNAVPASARVVNLAGEPLQNALVRDIYKLGAPTGVDRVYNLYGPSEDTTYSTFALVEKQTDRAPTIGRPISNTQAYLLDSRGNLVPQGALGELRLGGEGLARCYLNKPDLTAERFVPDPFSERPGARLYKTGDIARYSPDGNLQFLGRIDHQVKIRGFRIELGEIEAALREHPRAREAVVLARQDSPGEKRLVAYLVSDQEPAPTHGEARAFLKERLPEYMVPSAFVVLDELPLTPNGKVDRRALPAPDQARPEVEAAFAAPQTEIERELAAAWRETLGVERVGINDNFYDLGGDSLLLLTLKHKIQRRLRCDLPLMTMFRYPTVSALASHLSDGRKTEEPSPNRAQKQRMVIERRKKSVRRRPQA